VGVDLGEDLVDKGIVIVPADEVESLARRGDGTVVNVFDCGGRLTRKGIVDKGILVIILM